MKKEISKKAKIQIERNTNEYLKRRKRRQKERMCDGKRNWQKSKSTGRKKHKGIFEKKERQEERMNKRKKNE